MVGISSTLLVFMCYFIGCARSVCPDNWITFQESCYLFETQQEEFILAEQFCRQQNAHLLHIGTENENKFVRNWLKKLKPANWWLGMTDNVIEDIWKWTDTRTPLTYTDWYPGRPDDKDGSQDCGVYNQNLDFKWDDTTCNTGVYFICKMPKLDGVGIIG